MRRLLVALLICMPGLLAAQQITVRGGEHGEFTRLVFRLPPSAEWSVENAGGSANVRIDPAGGYDLSRAFERINRARVAELLEGPEPEEIIVRFACNCRADAFQLGDLLVVDLSEGSVEGAAEATGATTDDARGGPEQSSLRASLSEIRIGSAPGIGPRGAPMPLLPSLENPGPDIVQSSTSAASETNLQDSELGGDLARQLAQAATQGLLTASASTQAPAPQLPETSVLPVIAEPAQAVSEDLAPFLESLSGTASRDARVRIGGQACVGSNELDVAAWAPEGKPLEALAQGRQALFGEFDRPDPEAIRELARIYIHLGFGAEAKAVQAFQPGGADPVLMALAEIVDGGIASAGRLAGMTGCETSAALWSLIGYDDIPPGSPVDTGSVLRTFSELPRHLRISLGPRLVQRLAEEGYREAAREVVVRLERMMGGTNDEIALEVARIDALDGAIAEAQDALSSLAASPSSVTADAVVDSLELTSQTGGEVPASVVQLSGALATEYRGQEKGPALWLSHIRALLASAAFDEAFAALEDSGDIPQEIVSVAATEAFVELGRNAEDIEFLKHALQHGELAEQITEEEPHHEVARRLLDSGFPGEALTALDRGGDRRKDRLLRAEILLSDGQPGEAEVALAALDGEDVSALRARARAAMGDHAFAETLFAGVGAQESATRAAWLAGDWQRLTGSESGALAETARLLLEEEPSVIASAPTLVDAESVAQTAAQTRETLRSLLEETRLSAPPPQP